MTSLVDKSLLQHEDGPGGGPRFRMLETIREFAQGCLEASGEATAVRKRLEQYFVAWAEAAEPQLMGPEQVRWLDRLQADLDNLRAVLTWAAEGGSVEAGLRLAPALRGFWSVRGGGEEGRERLLHLLALPGAAARTKTRARALQVAGYLSYSPAGEQPARALSEESLAISQELGDAARDRRVPGLPGMGGSHRERSRAG